MKSIVTFDESSWTIIEPLLPDDTSIRETVLEDIMWFMKRGKKYKNNKEKVEDYIRHLQLKANPLIDLRPDETRCFKCLDIERIRGVLQIEKDK